MSNQKVGIGGYIALILVIIFFSGIIAEMDFLPEQFKVLDFTSMLGSYGEVLGPDGESTTTSEVMVVILLGMGSCFPSG